MIWTCPGETCDSLSPLRAETSASSTGLGRPRPRPNTGNSIKASSTSSSRSKHSPLYISYLYKQLIQVLRKAGIVNVRGLLGFTGEG